MFNGQALQDKFVLTILKQKRNGFFLEIGSNHPININNSYVLETSYGWKGIMVEYDSAFLPLYQTHRPNSIHVINDATTVDYKSIMDNNHFPKNMDFLQIDLEANNGSTIRTLELLDTTVFDTYKFATVTFEHDIYHTNFDNTRNKSRDIFQKRGYVRIFSDVSYKGNPFEDWYVHPDLVDMNLVNTIIERNTNRYGTHPITGTHIDSNLILFDV